MVEKKYIETIDGNLVGLEESKFENKNFWLGNREYKREEAIEIKEWLEKFIEETYPFKIEYKDSFVLVKEKGRESPIASFNWYILGHEEAQKRATEFMKKLDKNSITSNIQVRK